MFFIRLYVELESRNEAAKAAANENWKWHVSSNCINEYNNCVIKVWFVPVNWFSKNNGCKKTPNVGVTGFQAVISIRCEQSLSFVLFSLEESSVVKHLLSNMFIL